MEKISAIVITKNNAPIIERCLKSIQWADEIIIVDSGSTDKTLEICRKYNCSIYKTPWLGFGKTKKFAEEKANYQWIFSIDSDEECTKELHQQIRDIFSDGKQNITGAKIKRRTFYLKKFIKYSGWQKDYPLRLYNKNFGGFNNRNIHEFVEVTGKIISIKGPILHYSFPTIESHFEKINTYTTLGAEDAIAKGKKSSPGIAVVKGWFKFFKMYILQLGMLDGTMGFVLAKNSSFGTYIKYLKIYQWSSTSR